MATSGSGFFAIPHTAVYLLLTANIAVFALCANQAGAASIPTSMLFRDGAMYWQALPTHQYWRLAAYGFLHANPIHLASNLLCLVLWGGHLERRVGSTYFIALYFCTLVFAAIIGNYLHSTPYLTVGASGATSGILGALVCLWILGKLDFPANFFVVNIGLNVVLALGNRGIDWGVHLGGFAAGLIACAVLDLIEKANTLLLRCKFPEYVKANILALSCTIGVLSWSGPAAQSAAGESYGALALAIGCAATYLVVVKTIDVALSIRKGLAIVIVAFATANAVVVLIAGLEYAPLSCAARWPDTSAMFQDAANATCVNPVLICGILAALVFILTLLLASEELSRGVRDVGFIGASLRAERKRHWGI